MPSRHRCRKTTVPQKGLTVVRILIASYFMANATGGLMTSADPVTLVVNLAVLATALVVMLGVGFRHAAVVLAGFIFVTGFVLGTGPETLAALARDTALLGTMLLIALNTTDLPRPAPRLSPAQTAANSNPAPSMPAKIGDDTPDNIFVDLWEAPAAPSIVA